MSVTSVRVPTAYIEYRVGDTCQVRGRNRDNYFSIERFGTEIAHLFGVTEKRETAILRNDRTGRLAGWCWVSELLPDDRRH